MLISPSEKQNRDSVVGVGFAFMGVSSMLISIFVRLNG
jgi:hypothetical protein